jgi:hypothetical protein
VFISCHCHGGNHDIDFPMSIIQDYKLQGGSTYVWGMCLMEACLGFGFTMVVSSRPMRAAPQSLVQSVGTKDAGPPRTIPDPPWEEAPSKEVLPGYW